MESETCADGKGAWEVSNKGPDLHLALGCKGY